jgi:hypothetical protein
LTVGRDVIVGAHVAAGGEYVRPLQELSRLPATNPPSVLMSTSIIRSPLR